MSKQNDDKSSRLENYSGLVGAAAGAFTMAVTPGVIGAKVISFTSYKVCAAINQAMQHTPSAEEYATIIGYGTVLAGVTYGLSLGCKDNLAIFKACLVFGIDKGIKAGESVGRTVHKLFTQNKDNSGNDQTPVEKPAGYKYS